MGTGTVFHRRPNQCRDGAGHECHHEGDFLHGAGGQRDGGPIRLDLASGRGACVHGVQSICEFHRFSSRLGRGQGEVR